MKILIYAGQLPLATRESGDGGFSSPRPPVYLIAKARAVQGVDLATFMLPSSEKRAMTLKTSQKFILYAKRFYWAIRKDPLGWRATSKWRRAVIRAAEIARYAVTGKANLGFCPVCEKNTMSLEKSAWLRDKYLCAKCDSIPRVRHVIHVLQRQFPRFREWAIHESSPSGPSFDKLSKEYPGYLPTQYWPDTAPGTHKNGFRCKILEALTFSDASFDLVIT